MKENEKLDFIADGGHMGALIRAFDWTRHPMGAPSGWPQPLRTVLRILLTTGHPMYVWWGPELYCFYNDAFSRSIGPERHPGSLGQPGRQVWAEIWGIIGPQIDQVVSGGESTWHENALVPITRYGRLEDAHWTYSYGPIDDPAAPTGVGGVLVVCSETTMQAAVRGSEARFRFLDRLTALIIEHTSPEAILATTTRMLAEHLGVSVCAYADMDLDEDGFTIRGDWAATGVQSIVGHYRLADFGALAVTNLHAGIPLVTNDNLEELGREDAALFLKLGLRATICMPLIKHGRLTALMAVHCDAPHVWTSEELALVGEVTERSWAHIERARSDAALREADRRKDEFIATLAHELRNPLAPIRSASLVAKSPNATEAQRQWSHDVIDRQVRQMALLLDDLLDVSRITRGTLQLRLGRVELSAVVDTAIETARPLIDARHHALVVTLPPEPVWLEADALRLAQVIANLLTNAAKYSDPQSRIELHAEVAPREIQIRVSDTGIGIDAQQLPRIFEMFSQGQAALDRSEGGLGIGLSLVKGLVSLHGGSIEAASPGLGKGSTFTVRLPARAQSETAAVRRSADSDPSAHIDPQRILIVDDNYDAADSLSLLLRLDGHEIQLAHDGLTALDIASQFKPDVILLDIGMPRMNGYEVARQIRTQERMHDVKLIAITGWGQVEDKRRAAEAGFDRHLVKPIDTEELRRLIGELRGASRNG